ncbi:MAG: hypothetical protein AAFR58_16450 [Cyanobacteria bacterium J06627_28]
MKSLTSQWFLLLLAIALIGCTAQKTAQTEQTSTDPVDAVPTPLDSSTAPATTASAIPPGKYCYAKVDDQSGSTGDQFARLTIADDSTITGELQGGAEGALFNQAFEGASDGASGGASDGNSLSLTVLTIQPGKANETTNKTWQLTSESLTTDLAILSVVDCDSGVDLLLDASGISTLGL